MNTALTKPRLKTTSIQEGHFEKQADGSYLTHFTRKKYPSHGMAVDEAMWATEMLKKYIMGWVNFLTNPPWRWIPAWIAQFERYAESVTDVYVVPHALSPAVRALHDCLVILFPERKIAVRGAVGVIEHDKHYRYVLQDLAMVANRDALCRTPRKELCRLIDIFAEREKRGNWKRLATYVKLAVYLIPFIPRTANRIAKQMDLESLHMDKYDMYWACLESGDPNMSYHYFGYSKEKLQEIAQNL